MYIDEVRECERQEGREERQRERDQERKDQGGEDLNNRREGLLGVKSLAGIILVVLVLVSNYCLY